MDELLSKWDEIIENFKKDFEIGSLSYNTWIKPLEIHSVENEVVTIVSKETESVGINIIKKKYLTPLQFSINDTLGKNYTLRILSASEVENQEKSTPNETKPAVNNSEYARNLNPNYTFDNFIVGTNNRFAHAASVSVAEEPATEYNPLFIHGGAGLGKTHLMQAIAHHIIDTRPDFKVLYVTSETFTNEIIKAIGDRNVEKFREKYRNVDVLLIDDIQFVIGKESTQEEFFHTFNDLYQHNKQIVITSDKPPSEMATLEDRLRTRFSEGLICDIQVPTYETIRAILDNKIEKKKGLDIPEDVKDYIASNVKSSIRELEGAINNLSAFASLSGSPITLSLAQEALKDLISSNNKREVNVELIMEIVAEHFHISINDLVSSKRNASISKPRQIVMYLCRQMTQESALNIAKKLGKKDHSTVIHGAKAITEELLTDENLKNTINILIKKIDPN